MGHENLLKVVVAEDEELILHHIIKNIPVADPAFTAVGAAQNGKRALELIEEHSPDLLLSDIRMPVMDGLELLKNVALGYPYIKTIIISGYSEFEYAKQAIKYGVKDYLLKPLELEELREALRKVKITLESETDFLNRKIAAAEYGTEEVVDIVAQFIKENYAQEINLNSLAKHFNFNASYLSKLFKKHFDETPVRYLLNLRINEAKHLLRGRPELDIKTVGALVGYPDPFYFSRIFKQMTGKSPSEFREPS